MTRRVGLCCFIIFVILITSKASSLSNMATTVPRTFHRRILPSTCTALNSKLGKQMFESALVGKGLKSFFPLIEQFTTQSEPAYCGISTLVMVLNALSVDPKQVWKGSWRWYEESMLNCCISLEKVKESGITMNTFVCLARCQGLQVKPQLASDCPLEDFRLAVEKACVETDGCECAPQPFLVASYSRKVLNQTGDGHFSPIAAYDKATDQVLILDTARFKYGPHWVPLELLYQAMQPLDKTTQKSRGFVSFSFAGNNDEKQMPQSVLFVTRDLQNEVRREYKTFLKDNGDSISWEMVSSFWTRNGKDPSLVWQAVQIQKAILNGNAGCSQQAEDVLELVQKLIPGDFEHIVTTGGDSKCYSTTTQAIFVMYLASLDSAVRHEVVFNANVSASEETRLQLLAEAQLVQYAIEVSDEPDLVSSCEKCCARTS